MSPTLPASASELSVFLTGATGYVGGTYLKTLLELPHPPKLVTCLIRSEDKIPLLESLSTPKTTLKGVHGTLQDLEVITKLAEEHDVTIETADSDDLAMMNAILKGLKARSESGKESVLIHVSGTGTLTDDDRGEFEGKNIYSDALEPGPGEKPISALPLTAFHRSIDLAIDDADAKGWARTYITLPGTIWGEGNGPLFEKGVSNKHSMQIPQAARISLDNGRPLVVGKGLNVWPHIHIDDVGSQFEVVYRGAISNSIPHGAQGYYLATVGEYQLLEALKTIGKTMLANGWTKDPTPRPMEEADVNKYYMKTEERGGSKWYAGSNSRGVSAKAKEFGWKPKHTDVKEFYEYCASETERLGKQGGPWWPPKNKLG